MEVAPSRESYERSYASGRHVFACGHYLVVIAAFVAAERAAEATEFGEVAVAEIDQKPPYLLLKHYDQSYDADTYYLSHDRR